MPTSPALATALEGQPADISRRLKYLPNSRCRLAFHGRSRNNSGIWGTPSATSQRRQAKRPTHIQALRGTPVGDAELVSGISPNRRLPRSALLGDAIGGPDVPAVAAPARAEDVSGLPATYVEVGELDIFRDESIDYARRIAAAGTSVELHVHPGCPHGFERMSSEADVVRRSRADRIRALRSF